MRPKTLVDRIAGEVLLPTDDASEQPRNVPPGRSDGLR